MKSELKKKNLNFNEAVVCLFDYKCMYILKCITLRHVCGRLCPYLFLLHLCAVFSYLLHWTILHLFLCCVEAEVAEGDSVSEEPEDKDFWEGVTKPASTESSTLDSEVEPHTRYNTFCCLYSCAVVFSFFKTINFWTALLMYVFSTILQTPQEPQEHSSHDNDSKESLNK